MEQLPLALLGGHGTRGTKSVCKCRRWGDAEAEVWWLWAAGGYRTSMHAYGGPPPTLDCLNALTSSTGQLSPCSCEASEGRDGRVGPSNPADTCTRLTAHRRGGLGCRLQATAHPHPRPARPIGRHSAHIPRA